MNYILRMFYSASGKMQSVTCKPRKQLVIEFVFNYVRMGPAREDMNSIN